MNNVINYIILAGLVSSCTGFLDSLYFQLDASCQGTKSFVCKNSKCVPKSKRCDGHADCLDSSDEEDCDLFFCKGPNYFKCKNEKCIFSSFVCDDENDCLDFSDEKDCKNFKLQLNHATNCTSEEWQCADRLCIPKEFVCNGESDCLDGSDETMGCTLNLECDGFKCKNGHCVPNEWRCDGNNDCHDDSDELDCQSHISPKDCLMENKLFLCSNNLTCINMTNVCDKIPHCPDKSDEGPKCTSTDVCATHKCSHECVQLPTGPKCLCPEGYQTIDDKTCKDINECETYGICDQKCTNKPGSYECYCDNKYELQPDKKTCKVVGGEAMMIYSSKTEIRGYFLESELMFPIAKNLKQVVGVSFDGHHVYWTDILSEHESIVRSLEDGSKRELLVTSGLGAPEDLAIDWITGNIYFTDSEIQHIGVCVNDGTKCTVLVNQDVNKPRGIALYPIEGDMYWSDWGKNPVIAKSKMDGTHDIPFVANNIKWPNGLAIDYPNERLYWADAKLSTLESIRLDGTDRRIVLDGIVKHPYAIAVFENTLIWSDWHSRSVQSCNKFTGKEHHTLIKEKKEYIYGLHIFHSALKPQSRNPCISAFCSDICLNTGPTSYTCACPQDKELAADKHTCKEVYKKQELIIGVNDLLIRIEHKILGKHHITSLSTPVKNIGALAYNPINDTLYVSDNAKHMIISINLKTEFNTPVVTEHLENVNSLEYDAYGNNLYWCDIGRKTIEVFSLSTMSRTTLLHDMGGETPQSIALVPQEGVMFIALEKQSGMSVHIDRMRMDGSARTHSIETGLIGPVTLHYDVGLHRIFWADGGGSNIESTSADGDDRHAFRSLKTMPISITTLKNDLFWVNYNSRRLYWAKKDNSLNSNKKITLDIPEHTETMHLISITPNTIISHPCQKNNGFCSHICLAIDQAVKCACPIGMNLQPNNLTCIKPRECSTEEFHCDKSDVCVAKTMRCNGRKDCSLGEDEEDCFYAKVCPKSYFQCGNGDCIRKSLVCDLHFDCEDKSDEAKCTDVKKSCESNQFRCSTGDCISGMFLCDGIKDCNDGEDEENCRVLTCSSKQFRCQSGLCIPKDWECDHEFDCPDLSDEHNNCTRKKCNSKQFTCDNNMCIDVKLKCNNIDDCGDSSDESSCVIKPAAECRPNEFQCKSDNSICIPTTALCNGTSECPHHEDEQGCSNCHIDEFTCDNKKCVPSLWICDGIDDCGDSSDEAICSIDSKFENQNIPCDNGFRCKSGACIDSSLVCNGLENCYDGSDENGACNSSCKATSNPCDHTCKPTPTGPMCTCKEGYELTGDGHSCRDIEECSKEPPICSQKCTEKTGGFICDCFDGYLIRSDKLSCKSIGDPMSLIYAVGNEIRQLSQSDNSLKIVHSEETTKISGLDIDVSRNHIYFTIEESSTILRLNLQNANRDFIRGIGKPQKLAVDWLTKNVYYVNGETAEKSIRACSFQEKRCSKIISLDSHSQVSALAIDAVNKYMFYSLTSWWVFNNPRTVLYKANLDGSRLTELVKSTSGYITGITYDANRRLLYYIDQHIGNINRINYDGSDKSVTFTNVTKSNGLNLFEDHLYFLTSYGYMSKCKLFDQRTCESFRLNAYSVESFAIVQSTKQPTGLNLCEGHVCNHLCVPSDLGVHCVCENGKVVGEGVDCGKAQKILDKHPTFGTHIPKGYGDESNSTLAAIIIPILIVLICLGAYYVVKKRSSGKFTVSMRFQNPVYGVSPNESSRAMLQPGEHEYSNPININQHDFQVATNAILEKVTPLVRIED